MMGYFIAIVNDDGIINPIHWKLKVIDNVSQESRCKNS